MKRIITSFGLAAVGAAGVQAAGYMPGYGSTDASRPWSVSASLQGFYDSNPYTAPNGSPYKEGSWGFSVYPSVGVALSTDTTDFGARYTFGYNWYANRVDNPADYSNQFDLAINHNFSPRYNLFVGDSFVQSTEPTVLDPINPAGMPWRTDASNWRNTGSITFNAQLTQLLTGVIGYANTLYDYQQNASDVRTVPALGNAIGGGSYSALLNRMEQLILANLRWQMTPDTVGVLGYQYGMIDFTGDQWIVPSNIDPSIFLGTNKKSDSRNSRSQYMYLGADHTFNPDFYGSLRAGAQYVDSYNLNPPFTQWAPYADLSLTYRYGIGSRVELGFRQFITQTWALAANTSSSVVYGAINHHFTPQLTGTVMGQFQYASFNGQVVRGPTYDYAGQSQNYYLAGVNLSYQFIRYLAANVGYSYDALASNDNALGNYNRNRFFFGLTASY